MTKTYSQALREFQMSFLIDALVEAKGNVGEAALALEIHRNTFARTLYNACFLTPERVCAILKEQGLIPRREIPELTEREKAQKPHPRTVRSNKFAEKLSLSRVA